MDFSKSKYSESEIKNKIYEIMNSMNIKRMPSRSEIQLYTQSTKISNIIMKTGGFYYWAEKLKIDTKKSETRNSMEYEFKCANFFIEKGYKSEITSIKFPYDILINESTKIDVKISNGYNGNKGFFFTFNLEYIYPKSDFYVCYCVNELQNKILVIPSHKMYGKNQLSVGLKSKYDIYINRFDLIEKHIKLMKEF